MKALLFIDANIYLGIYAPTSFHLPKMIAPLKDASNSVFVTKQMVFEVQRNKVKVFADAAIKLRTEYLKQLSLPPLTASPASVEEFTNKAKAHASTFEGNLKRLIEEIRDATDQISLGLAEIFKDAVEATDAEWTRARTRKERGNPPGKQTDPLGDQLSWEQLLSTVEGGQSVWVVSNDGDYYDDYLGTTRLKPLLHEELKKKIGSGEVHCFRDLADALPHFSRNAKQLSLPDSNEITEIKAEEFTAAANTAIATSNVFFGQGLGAFQHPGLLSSCKKCNKSSFIVRAKLGGAGLGTGQPEWVCEACGEPWP